MLKISSVSLSTLAYEHLHQWRGYIYLSPYAGVHNRAAEFSPWINCSWKLCYSNVQAKTVLKDCWNPRPTSIGLYGSIPYACGMSIIETSCPGDTPASLMSIHPWSSSFGTLLRTILSVAIILHVLLTEANVGIAQWVQLSFIPKAIISVFSLSKSPEMRKFTIICIYSWTASL